MYNRIHYSGLHISGLDEEGFYKMTIHKQEKKNENRVKVLDEGRAR